MRGLALALWVIVLPLGASADGAQIVAAWQAWAERANVSKAALVVLKSGQVLTEDEIGVPRGHVFEMASLSKAVTAVCVAKRVEDRALSYNDLIAEWGDWDITNPVVEAATLRDALHHTTGLMLDVTQRKMFRWLGDGIPRHGEIADLTLTARKTSKTGRVFRYNNDNYAVLGDILETASGGVPFDELCAQPGLSLSPKTGGFVTWGGWQASVLDYARFAHAYFGAGSAIGANPARYPHVAVSDGAYYGMGMLWRSHDGGYLHWHHGAYCFFFQFFSSSFVLVAGDTTVVTAFERCVPEEVSEDLEVSLAKALLP